MNNPAKVPLTKLIFTPRMLVALVMGFSAGMPLLLTIGVLQAWMTEAGVDLKAIGLMALVGLPYSLKMFWAPFLDRYTLPFLGRRRGWLLVAQILLALAIFGLGQSRPAESPWLLALAAMLVTFFSASQDIVIDAYRREDLTDRELGLGSSLYIWGYRLGMLLAGGGGLILADHMPYSMVYAVMALCMAPGIITTLLCREPPVSEAPPQTLRKAVFEPFLEFFSRDAALWILAFIFFYKVGDTMASHMTTPFYLQLGYTKTDIGAVVKIFGTWATIGGAIFGGALMLRLGIHRSLWIFGVLQALSTACFAILAHLPPQNWALAGVIAFENLSGGMGTAAFVAFMASITNKKFTATQYALLSSFMALPRITASAATGYLAENLGWTWFFVGCALIAIPGLLILFRFASWNNETEAP